MLKSLEGSQPEVTIEGIIFQKYVFNGKTVCIACFDPETKTWGIAENFEGPFRKMKDETELKKELIRIDQSLRSN
jgi:hypothetical protein